MFGQVICISQCEQTLVPMKAELCKITSESLRLSDNMVLSFVQGSVAVNYSRL